MVSFSIIRIEPKRYYCIDTYANLLYKVGRINEAIAAEEIAIKLAIEQGALDIKESNEITLSKMKDGKPTWIIPAE